MANFTGMTVELTLKQPPNTLLHGVVSKVIAGQTLTLQDVSCPSNGQRWAHFTVEGSAIADLQVLQAKTIPTPITTNRSSVSTPATAVQTNAPPLPPPSRQSSAFVDPAILSYGKSPVPVRNASRPSDTPGTPSKSLLTQAVGALPANGTHHAPIVGGVVGPPKVAHENDGATNITLHTHRINHVGAQNGMEDDVHEVGLGEVGLKKRTRKGPKKKGTPSAGAGQDPPPIMNSEVSRNGNDMNGNVKRGKGWRQTPLLQPSPQNASTVDLSSGRKQSRKQREKEAEASQNGWATEDATDIQGMDDFDFEANHKLFDKRQIFDELRQGDTTADEDRLVSHNKLPRPGTYGGKNLHPTENVLSPKLEPTTNNAEIAASSDGDIELDFPNGRSSSRHSVSRTSIAKIRPSRQNSALLDGRTQPLTTSMSSDRGGLSRSATSLASKSRKQAPSLAASSPRPDGTRSPQSTVSRAKQAKTPAAVAHEARFMIQQTLVTCPVLLPAAIDTLEAETTSRFGLTRESITESAARCVAEIAMSMFETSAGGRRGSRSNRGSMTSSLTLDRGAVPVIVILAGAHGVGASAVAAARHLVFRKTRIIVAEAQYGLEDAQVMRMRAQTTMLKRMTRSGASGVKCGSWHKASSYIKNLTGPPVLIIDALLAGATYQSLVDSHAGNASEVLKEAREMIDWANRSRAPVLSVGCPSGVSGVDGSATIVEGEPLAVRPDKTLSLGAPMRGLLEAMRNGERWDLSLGDVGVNITLRSDEAVAFGSQWVVDLTYVEEAAVDTAQS